MALSVLIRAGGVYGHLLPRWAADLSRKKLLRLVLPSQQGSGSRANFSSSPSAAAATSLPPTPPTLYGRRDLTPEAERRLMKMVSQFGERLEFANTPFTTIIPGPLQPHSPPAFPPTEAAAAEEAVTNGVQTQRAVGKKKRVDGLKALETITLK
ncbi:hypothetical protein PG994_001078 [Apiospora phragmitis]|uniref:Uncharacterized protein n=1 Tax=Apiospora phragmitis TaxID=2905665 RepID=A0ABR1WSH9_9PEZI